MTAPGMDVQEAIARELKDADLHVLMATPTYGVQTNPLFSTRQEFNWAMTQNTAFLINMTSSNEPGKVWTDPAFAVAASTATVWKRWDPKPTDDLSPRSVPEDLIDAILKGLPVPTARPGDDSSRRSSAPSTPAESPKTPKEMPPLTPPPLARVSSAPASTRSVVAPADTRV